MTGMRLRRVPRRGCGQGLQGACTLPGSNSRTGVIPLLFQHDRDRDPIGRAQWLQPQRMAPQWQVLPVRRAGDRTIEGGEAATAFLVPGPDGQGVQAEDSVTRGLGVVG
jgi:hypothetical protein